MSESESTPAKPKRAIRSIGKKAPAPPIEPSASPAARPASAPELEVPRLEPVSWMFLVCLFVGAALAFLGLSSDPILRVIGFMGPIAMTIAYPIWGGLSRTYARPSVRERFGDNCYYLGFIFTQIALVAGFLPVALLNKQISSQDVLRFFGVALGASLIGLVARTLFSQTGHTVSETADMVEQDVEALAKLIQQKSAQILKHFEALSDKVTGVHRQLANELVGSVTTLTGALAGYDAAVRGQVESLEATSVRISAIGNTAATNMDLHQQQLIAALQATLGAIEKIPLALNMQLNEKVAEASKRIAQLPNALQSEVSSAAEAFRNTSSVLTRAAGALDATKTISHSVDAVQTKLSEIDTAISGIKGSLSQSSSEVIALTEKTKSEIDTAISGIKGSMSQSSREVIALTEKTKADAKAYTDSAAASAREHAETLRLQLAESVSTLTSVLNDFRSELERIRA